ncbi:molybdopterin-dependent oxidoreductase [Sandarakinorhabdus sp. DWP1-3-1]|uniref:molybdopterin-dependent oxidoreductase n=1 Tax=Sandarakinorhabdus sp. DWP1-3-1 TaxID=2804627 RepID=UPI003CF117D6
MMLALLLAAATPIAIDAAARAGLPAATATLTAHGKTSSCTGVRLSDLVARAGLPTGEAVRGQALVTVIVAEATDGYRVVFSLGEIDAKLGNAAIIVADRCDGRPLAAADGPLRLVVPGEARAARSVRALARLQAVVAAP